MIRNSFLTVIELKVGHFISQFHVLFLSVALGSLATMPTTYLLLGKSPYFFELDSITFMLFTGIDFLINLNGCLSVYKKKKEGELAEAGIELMVNQILNLFLLRCSCSH